MVGVVRCVVDCKSVDFRFWDGPAAGSQDPNHAARISLDQTTMQIEFTGVALSPGMAPTVEVNTGSRSVISFWLSPLARYRHEILRER